MIKMNKQYDDLLSAASDLTLNEEEKIIPDDMEEWICTNDPSIDPLFRGMLLPKGAQDKTKAYIEHVRQQQKKLFQQQRIERQQQREEYLEYLQQLGLTEDDEYFDSNDEVIITGLDNVSSSLNHSNNVSVNIDENIEEDISKLPVEEVDISIQTNAINKSIQVYEDIHNKPVQISSKKDNKQPVQLTADIRQSVDLRIDPELSATKNFINLLRLSEPLLNEQQKLQFLDKKFVNDSLGISLPLLIPYSDNESVRFINGHSRYINKIFIFNQQRWFLTNNIHKRNVDKLLVVLKQMLEDTLNKKKEE